MSISVDLSAVPDMASLPRTRALVDSALLRRLRSAISFDYLAVCGLDIESYEFGCLRSVDTNFPPNYLESYEAEKLYRVDPLVIQGRSTVVPLTDTEAFAQGNPPERLQYILAAHGIGIRTLFPLRREEVLFGAVVFSRADAFNDEELDFLCTISELVHSEVTKSIMQRFAIDVLRLSVGELECLRLAGHGFTSDEIAARTDYQTETVNTYLKHATRKLGARNRTHAVAAALRRKLID